VGVTATDATAAFAAEVGPPKAGPVVAVGGHTQWDVGRLADGAAASPPAREVRPPAGVVALEAADMTVRVRAGTAVAELDAALAEVGQTVAMPPWTEATVGGVLAVGHSGLRQLGWGPVRDVLLEARVVSADGRVVKAGGPTVKNVSGYDLCRLLVGSLGTLALIAEVVLRTRPLPATERWLAGEADPFALAERLYRPASILWDGTTTWVLLDGHPADVEAQAAAALTGLTEVDGAPALPPHRWSLRPSELAGLPGRPSGPGAGTGRFVAEVGVGVVHAEQPPEPRPVDGHVVELHRRIKAAFDPTGRLNPGHDPLAAITPPRRSATPIANRRAGAPHSVTSERRNPGPGPDEPTMEPA
jgi:FAD/FMN-containing dehydrogenase